MKTASIPFTAFCPKCRAGRTFTLLAPYLVVDEGPTSAGLVRRVGCCVCGTNERDALVALSERAQDDLETIGEIAARVNALDSDVQDLRDETHDRITALADRLRRHQDNHLHAVLRDGQRIEGEKA